jgi:hypothetical protein
LFLALLLIDEAFYFLTSKETKPPKENTEPPVSKKENDLNMEHCYEGYTLPCGGERSCPLLQSQCHLAAQLCKTCKKEAMNKKSMFEQKETRARED